MMEELYQFAECMAESMDLDKALTPEGVSNFKEIGEVKLNADLEVMSNEIEESYENDDSGLIDCWRVVTYVNNTEEDMYTAITKRFKGVGVYWSWKDSAAEAHWGVSGGHSITLHGKLATQDVDWNGTLYQNAGDLAEECEIRTIENGNVMIVGFTDDTLNKYYPLEEPIVVSTGGATRPM